MATDDFFDTPVVHVDLFGSEVEALVELAYKAAIEGIDRLGERHRPRPDLAANPECQIEIDLWEQQISAMKCHAGNMGLVSLVCLFEDWLDKNGGFRDVAGSGLTRLRLQDIRTTRNSIIHHRGRQEFDDQWGKRHRVCDVFLGFDEVLGEERVAIEGSILADVAKELILYVKQWTDRKRT